MNNIWLAEYDMMIWEGIVKKLIQDNVEIIIYQAMFVKNCGIPFYITFFDWFVWLCVTEMHPQDSA